MQHDLTAKGIWAVLKYTVATVGHTNVIQGDKAYQQQ